MQDINNIKMNTSMVSVKSVIHMADIHIRLFRRHDEYESAFKKLYADIQEKIDTGLKDFVTVLAGDILHAKIDMSPEMIQVASKFLKKIADFGPTILIAGNHDCNLANLNRLDALTPIVDNVGHPNLYYARDSQIVTVADTDFAVFSIFGDPANWPKASECTSPNKIALYHGPVHGALNDSNYSLTNKDVRLTRFDGYDIAMLGDIHRHQVMQVASPIENKPIVVYASSLIQQNHGEAIDGHGWCLWDIPARTFEFIELVHDHAYVTVEEINGSMVYPANMPANIRVRMFSGGLDGIQTKKIITMLKDKYNVLEMSVNKNRTPVTKTRLNNISNQQLLNLSDVNTQNDLITQWLAVNSPSLPQEMINKVIALNVNTNHAISHEDFSRNVHWRPLIFTFSNMFSYGDDNEINFENMSGLYGIFAENASGKSSLMDSLMFCLYDKTPRAFKGEDIINNRKDSFECELTFEINSVVYGIKRVGTRKKTGEVKVDVNFWKVLDTGDKESLNGEDRRDTNANIRSYVGTYEDFVMTAMSNQKANDLFIDKSHSERKDLLIQFTGLNVLDKLNDVANVEVKGINAVLKRFKKSDITDLLSSTHNELLVARDELYKKEHELVNLIDINEKINQKITAIQSSKLPLRASIKPRSQIDTELYKNERVTAGIEAALATVLVNRSKTFSEMGIVADSLCKYTPELIEELFEAERNQVLDNHEVVKLTDTLKQSTAKLSHKRELVNKLNTYTYNQLCEVCVANNKNIIIDLSDAESCITDTLKDIEYLDSRLLELRNRIDSRSDILQNLVIYKAANDKKARLEAIFQAEEQLIKLKITELDNAILTKEALQAELDVYISHESTILFNQSIDEQIKQISPAYIEGKKEIAMFEKDLRELHGSISVLEAKKVDLINKLKEAQSMEAEAEAYAHYMNAIGRDGIPYDIITKTIPAIETEINAMLSQIVDFVVSLEVDGKNINGRLIYNYDRIWRLENSSGMERFITSLVIRVALLNASNLPKPNFFMIDEGFGALDKKHFNAVQTLFNLLKTQFTFILIVSHLDTAKDMVDNLIEIKKEDGYSQISV